MRGPPSPGRAWVARAGIIPWYSRGPGGGGGGGGEDVVIESVGSGTPTAYSRKAYAELVPNADTQLRGIRAPGQPAGMTLTARVWRVSDTSLVATSPVATVDDGVYEARFESEVTLLEGVTYRVGLSHIISSPALNAVNAVRTYEGFVVTNRAYYGGELDVYPTSSIFGWHTTFSLLVAP